MHSIKLYSPLEYFDSILDFPILFSLIIYGLVCLFAMFCFKLYSLNKSKNSNGEKLVWLTVAVFSVGILYGIRYNVGTDYGAYVKDYSEIGKVGDLSVCLKNSKTEISYALLSYVFSLYFDDTIYLFSFIGFLITFLIVYGLYRFNDKRILPIGFFIFYTDLFFFATNGVRFAIACSILFSGLHYLYHNKIIKYCLIVIISATFHKTMLIALFFVCLIDFKNKRLNFVRDSILYFSVLFSYFWVKWVFCVLEFIPLIGVYFFKYASILNATPKFGFGILRILIPILIVLMFRKRLLNMNRNNILLINILLCKIPLYISGYYIVWAARLQRIPELVSMVLFPVLIGSFKKNRMLLIIFWFVYTLLNFAYTRMLTCSDNVLPYQTIF